MFESFVDGDGVTYVITPVVNFGFYSFFRISAFSEDGELCSDHFMIDSSLSNVVDAVKDSVGCEVSE